MTNRCEKLGAFLLVTLALSGCGKQNGNSPAPNQSGNSGSLSSNSRTVGNGGNSSRQTGGDTGVAVDTTSPILPDAKLTPGDTLDVTKDDICVPGYSKKVRNVPQSVKEQAFASYGITGREPGQYEVDHLISLELGGSNSLRNLWPQSFRTQPWNARVKDALENELHRRVCDGSLDLATAQRDIATDWISTYKKVFKTDLPKSSNSASRSSRQVQANEDEAATLSAGGANAGGDGQVWVNTRSGVIWKPGSQYYGKTKEGQYMSESEAMQKGYHEPKGGQ